MRSGAPPFQPGFDYTVELDIPEQSYELNHDKMLVDKAVEMVMVSS
jgi:hypothetical protein